MSNEIIVRVNGWDLVAQEGKIEEAKIRDVDLAKRLGYSRTRDIRKIIKGLIDAGHLPGICVSATVARTQMPTGGVRETTVEEYLLNEEETLLVTVQSDTPAAMSVKKEMIAVFVALRRGLVAGQPSDQIIAQLKGELRTELLCIKERIDDLGRHKYGLLDKDDAAELRRQMTEVAWMRVNLGEAGRFLSIYRKVDDAIRREVDFPNEKGAKWEICPSEKGTRAFSRVGMMRNAASVDLKKKLAREKEEQDARQLEMFKKALKG